MADYFYGLALGQSNKPTAMAIIERDGEACRVRELKRYPMTAGYPDIVADTSAMFEKEPLKGKGNLIIDATAAGEPVAELFRHEKSLRRLHVGHLYHVVITAGDVESHERRLWRVPKRALVSVVQILLQSKRLQIAPMLELAGVLTSELSTFRADVRAGATNDMTDWREGADDDLVFAVALAGWQASKKNDISLFGFSVLDLGSGPAWHNLGHDFHGWPL